MDKTRLYLLWTNDNLITSEKMVFMYTINSRLHKWWDDIILIIWGATVKLASENKLIQEKINQAMKAGVQVSACKSCSEQLGVTEILEKLGIEVKYWGEPLTELLKNNERILTI